MPNVNVEGGLAVPRRSTDGGLSVDSGLTGTTVANGGSAFIARRSTDGGHSANLSTASNVSAATLLNGSATNNGDGSTMFPELEGKDAAQQAEILNNLLEIENRIKEGAENLLRMKLMVRHGCSDPLHWLTRCPSGYNSARASGIRARTGQQ